MGGYLSAESLPIRSCGQRLARTLDDRLQRLGAGVLVGIEAFGVASHAMFVDQGEAEAALAWCDDQALQRCEGLGERAEGALDMVMSSHIVGGSCKRHGIRSVHNRNVPVTSLLRRRKTCLEQGSQ